jgi:hypothetical protein
MGNAANDECSLWEMRQIANAIDKSAANDEWPLGKMRQMANAATNGR